MAFRPVVFRLAAALALTGLAACSSSSKKEDPAPAREMSWTVDGAAVTTTTLQSQQSANVVTLSGTVNPGSTATRFLSLEFPAAVGTYTFGPSLTASGVYSAGGAVYFAGGTGLGTVTGGGTVVVMSLTATDVAGTFTFTGIDNNGAAKSVTNGKFNVGL